VNILCLRNDYVVAQLFDVTLVKKMLSVF